MSNLFVRSLVGAILLAGVCASISPAQRGNSGALPGVVNPGNARDLGLFRETRHHFPSNRSVTVSEENGVRTIHVVEDGLAVSLTETADDRIRMRITRKYGPDQLGQLMESQPELYMYLKSIPTEFGASQIELSVDVTNHYEAANPHDLKERFPEAHEIYERFSKIQPIEELQFFQLEPGVIILDGKPFLVDPKTGRPLKDAKDNSDDGASKDGRGRRGGNDKQFR